MAQQQQKTIRVLVRRFLVLVITGYNVVLSFGSANYTVTSAAFEQGTPASPSSAACRDGLNFSTSNANFAEIFEPPPVEGDRHKLYLVLMAPFPGPSNPSWEAGHRVAPAAQLALDQINNSSDILRDYELILLKSDTACSDGYEVVKALINIVRVSDRPIVGIVGPGCTSAAIAVAEQVSRPQYSLIAITPSATSPNLENAKYKNTFATISSSTAYVKVYRALMDHNGWNAVSILYDEQRQYFLDTFRKFSEEEMNASRIVYNSPVLDGKMEKFFPLSDIKQMDRGRVILSFAATNTARDMMCLAYHEGMIFPTYQWVFHDRTVSQLKQSTRFKYNEEEYNCSEKEMAQAINGILLVQYKIERDGPDIISRTGQNFSEYYESYMEELSRCTNDSDLNYANTNYDAVWALALALNKAAERVDLTTYRYGQPNVTKLIRKELFKVTFDGASGPILFRNESRSTVTDIRVIQLKLNKTNWDIEEVEVAFFNGSLTVHDLPNESAVFIGDTFDNKHVFIHKALGILVILIASTLLGFTGTLHIANTVWYRYRSIKATSPNISHLIFGGCYLFGISIIIYSVQQTFDWSEIVYSVLCNSFRWSLILGYTLIFGTVLAKVWRVYRLFKHFRNKSPGYLVLDSALIIFVVLLLLADMVLCIIWDITDPFMYEEYVESRILINKIPSLLIRSTCNCRHFSLWIGLVGTYKGTIALLLVAFSILNRKIRRRDFQHTTKINILIYSLTMMGGVFFPIYFLLRGSNIHISFVILCMILSITILMSCLMLFLTPVGQVIKVKMELDEDAKFTQEFKRRISAISLLSFLSADENS